MFPSGSGTPAPAVDPAQYQQQQQQQAALMQQTMQMIGLGTMTNPTAMLASQQQMQLQQQLQQQQLQAFMQLLNNQQTQQKNAAMAAVAQQVQLAQQQQQQQMPATSASTEAQKSALIEAQNKLLLQHLQQQQQQQQQNRLTQGSASPLIAASTSQLLRQRVRDTPPPPPPPPPRPKPSIQLLEPPRRPSLMSNLDNQPQQQQQQPRRPAPTLIPPAQTLRVDVNNENAVVQPSPAAAANSPDEVVEVKKPELPEKRVISEKLEQIEKEKKDKEIHIATLQKRMEALKQLKAHEGDENSDSDVEYEMEEEMPLAEKIFRQNEANKAKDVGEKRLLEFWPPLYVEPWEAPGVAELFDEWELLRPTLLNRMRNERLAREKREKYNTERYEQVFEAWTERVSKWENSSKRKKTELAHREIFEATFPELKKQREENERGERSERAFRRSMNFAQLPEGERGDDDLRMRRSAAIVPSLQEWKNDYFENNNNRARDEGATYKRRVEEFKNSWTSQEKQLFNNKFAIYGKNFAAIKMFLEEKSVKDVVWYYYLTKKQQNYKSIYKRKARKPGKSYRPPVMPREEDLVSLQPQLAEQGGRSVSVAMESKCFVCNLKIDASLNARVLTRSMYDVFGVDPRVTDIKVCNRCYQDVTRNRSSQKCLTRLCEQMKRKTKANRTMPPKWKNADEKLKRFIASFFGFPREMNKCCAACFKKISKKLDQVLSGEISSEVEKWEEGVSTRWPLAELNALDRLVEQSGHSWDTVASMLCGRTGEECRRQWENRHGEYEAATREQNVTQGQEEEGDEMGDDGETMDHDGLEVEDEATLDGSEMAGGDGADEEENTMDTSEPSTGDVVVPTSVITSLSGPSSESLLTNAGPSTSSAQPIFTDTSASGISILSTPAVSVSASIASSTVEQSVSLIATVSSAAASGGNQEQGRKSTHSISPSTSDEIVCLGETKRASSEKPASSASQTAAPQQQAPSVVASPVPLPGSSSQLHFGLGTSSAGDTGAMAKGSITQGTPLRAPSAEVATSTAGSTPAHVLPTPQQLDQQQQQIQQILQQHLHQQQQLRGGNDIRQQLQMMALGGQPAQVEEYMRAMQLLGAGNAQATQEELQRKICDYQKKTIELQNTELAFQRVLQATQQATPQLLQQKLTIDAEKERLSKMHRELQTAVQLSQLAQQMQALQPQRSTDLGLINAAAQQQQQQQAQQHQLQKQQEQQMRQEQQIQQQQQNQMQQQQLHQQKQQQEQKKPKTPPAPQTPAQMYYEAKRKLEDTQNAVAALSEKLTHTNAAIEKTRASLQGHETTLHTYQRLNLQSQVQGRQAIVADVQSQLAVHMRVVEQLEVELAHANTQLVEDSANFQKMAQQFAAANAAAGPSTSHSLSADFRTAQRLANKPLTPKLVPPPPPKTPPGCDPFQRAELKRLDREISDIERSMEALNEELKRIEAIRQQADKDLNRCYHANSDPGINDARERLRESHRLYAAHKMRLDNQRILWENASLRRLRFIESLTNPPSTNASASGVSGAGTAPQTTTTTTAAQGASNVEVATSEKEMHQQGGLGIAAAAHLPHLQSIQQHHQQMQQHLQLKEQIQKQHQQQPSTSKGVIGINRPHMAGGSISSGRSAAAVEDRGHHLVDKVIHEELMNRDGGGGEALKRKSGVVTCFMPSADPHHKQLAPHMRRTGSPQVMGSPSGSRPSSTFSHFPQASPNVHSALSPHISQLRTSTPSAQLPVSSMGSTMPLAPTPLAIPTPSSSSGFLPMSLPSPAPIPPPTSLLMAVSTSAEHRVQPEYEPLSPADENAPSPPRRPPSSDAAVSTGPMFSILDFDEPDFDELPPSRGPPLLPPPPPSFLLAPAVPVKQQFEPLSDDDE